MARHRKKTTVTNTSKEQKTLGDSHREPETKAERYPEPNEQKSVPQVTALTHNTGPKPPTDQLQASNAIPEGQLPDGFEPVSIEAVGVWKGEFGIWVKPIGYTLSDSKATATIPVRVQAVILCKLLDDAPVIPFGAGDNPRPIVAKRGDYIAVYYRPGLRDILKCGGITTWLAPNGERRVEGRADAMKLFTVAKRQGQKGKPLELMDDKDFRRETAGWPLPWERQRQETGDQYAGGGNYPPDDDIPF